MQAFLTLTRRELSGYFLSWTGYVIIAVVLFLLGLSFWSLLVALGTEPTPVPLSELFYETYYFWLILLLAAPIITMRLFANEKNSGTFETLMTAPVSDGQVVLAKYAGAMVFYLIMWLPMAGCILVLRSFSTGSDAVAPGTLGITYLGILLLGSLYVSLGCFASALTRSQIIAAMISFALGVTLFVLSFLSYSIPPQSGWMARVFGHISMLEHMRDFARGVVDTRQVVFYLSLTVLFLFLTLKVVESRRWK